MGDGATCRWAARGALRAGSSGGTREYGLVSMTRVKVCGRTNVGDARAALESGASVIGMNNRDLCDFSVDLGTLERLAPRRPSSRRAE